MTQHTDGPFRAGFACLVGRPNVGKSTLTNSLVGHKVAITSSRPQTTRHTIRGIVHQPSGQLILVDTPGLHRPRTLLGERLNSLVRATWSEVDVIGFCVPADATIGSGDRFIASELAALARRTPVFGIVTKTDLVAPQRVAEQLAGLAELARSAGFDEFAELVPVSAVDGFQVGLLADLLLARMPESPPLYPSGELTDEPEQTLVAELVREAALEGVLDVYVNLYVERDSQKAIVIGRGGQRLKEVGSRARTHIEALLGTAVYLDLHVKVAKDWQRDPKQLRRLGF
jgi:GTP-binding protein Era